MTYPPPSNLNYVWSRGITLEVVYDVLSLSSATIVGALTPFVDMQYEAGL